MISWVLEHNYIVLSISVAPVLVNRNHFPVKKYFKNTQGIQVLTFLRNINVDISHFKGKFGGSFSVPTTPHPGCRNKDSRVKNLNHQSRSWSKNNKTINSCNRVAEIFRFTSRPIRAGPAGIHFPWRCRLFFVENHGSMIFQSGIGIWFRLPTNIF